MKRRQTSQPYTTKRMLYVTFQFLEAGNEVQLFLAVQRTVRITSNTERKNSKLKKKKKVHHRSGIYGFGKLRWLHSVIYKYSWRMYHFDIKLEAKSENRNKVLWSKLYNNDSNVTKDEGTVFLFFFKFWRLFSPVVQMYTYFSL